MHESYVCVCVFTDVLLIERIACVCVWSLFFYLYMYIERYFSL